MSSTATHTEPVPVSAPGVSVDSVPGPIDPIDLIERVSDDADAAISLTDHEALTRRLDALSLQQALIDFELANARVLDLTARVIEATNASVRRQAELDGLRQRVAVIEAERVAADQRATESAAATAALTTEIAAIRSSSTYRVMRVIGRMRRLIGLGG